MKNKQTNKLVIILQKKLIIKLSQLKGQLFLVDLHVCSCAAVV